MMISTKRWTRDIATVLLGVALLGACWAISHRVPWSGHAVSLWSEKDLPPLPAEGENGWVLFHSTAATLGKDIPPRELRDALDHLEWARAMALAEPIRQLADDPAVRSQNVAAQAALASRRFADACAIDLEARCRYLELTRLHDVVALGALADALGGRWNEAFGRTGNLLRADLDLMRTSRSAVSALTVRRSVRKDLRLVGVLLDGIESGAPDHLAKQRATVASVGSVLDAGVEPATDVRRAIIAEYVYVTMAVRRISVSAASRVGRAWWMPLVLDTERTGEIANTYFEELMRFGESPSTREPPTLAHFSHRHFGWWAYNAGGKLLLDAALVDLVPAIRDMEKQKVEIEATRNALRQRVRALLEKLPEQAARKPGDGVPESPRHGER